MTNQPKHPPLWVIAGLLAALMTCSATLLASAGFLFLAPQLPSVEALKRIRPQLPLRIFTRDNQLLAEFGEKHTSPLAYKEIPPLFIAALLAAEDDRFFSHKGVDMKGLARAFVDLASTGSIHSGGSTITMQVAKNYFLSNERTFSRKFTEILLAREIENTLSKEEILTLYVNRIFLGHRAYGIGAAAQMYYGKPIHQLKLHQLAMIAGLPKAPSKYNPVVNPKRAMERRNWILGRMRALSSIDEKTYQENVRAPVALNFRNSISQVQGEYLAEMIRIEAESKYGNAIYETGWKIYTTVTASRQNAATAAVQAGLVAYDQRHGWRGAEAHDKPLDDFYPIGGLQPAKVEQLTATTAVVRLQDDTLAILPWAGMSWARPYINANSLGKAPKKPADIIDVGDIVRVHKKPDGNWQLLQVPAVQGAMLALNPDSGAIEAMVGGYDYTQSKFNRAMQGWRQAGSTLKPFVYAAALDNGYSPASIINDAPLSFADNGSSWRPGNSDGDFFGPIRLRRALYLSRNTVSIRLLQAIGIERGRDYVQRFGFTPSQLPRELTLALGSANVLPVQMATAYAALANGGYKVQPYFIDRIIDPAGKTVFRANPQRVCRECEVPLPALASAEQTTAGTSVASDAVIAPDAAVTATEELAAATPAVIYPKAAYPQAPRIIDSRIAYLTTSILRDVILHGTGMGALSTGRTDISGKTGTTNELKDAWFAGYSPEMVAITWVGFDTPATLGRTEFGGTAAVPIWSNFIRTALAGRPAVYRPTPSGIVSRTIDPTTGQLVPEGTPDAISELFLQEQLPAQEAAVPSGESTEGSEAQATPEELF